MGGRGGTNSASGGDKKRPIQWGEGSRKLRHSRKTIIYAEGLGVIYSLPRRGEKARTGKGEGGGYGGVQLLGQRAE